MHTCDEMDKQIVGILRAAADETKPEDQVALYAAQRIVELEQQLASCREELAQAKAAIVEDANLFEAISSVNLPKLIKFIDKGEIEKPDRLLIVATAALKMVLKHSWGRAGEPVLSQLAAADALRDAAKLLVAAIVNPDLMSGSRLDKVEKAISAYSAVRGK